MQNNKHNQKFAVILAIGIEISGICFRATQPIPGYALGMEISASVGMEYDKEDANGNIFKPGCFGPSSPHLHSLHPLKFQTPEYMESPWSSVARVIENIELVRKYREQLMRGGNRKPEE